MPSPDWTIAFDDVLCVRFRVCQWCSEPATHVELWVGLGGEAMCIAACRRCLDADTHGARRNALVEQQVQQRARAG
jgi:hypothetical protein